MDLKQHNIDIARIYEIIGEEYHLEGKVELARHLIDKAVDFYLQNPLDHIYLAKCYFILSEMFLEKKEYENLMFFSSFL